MWRTIVPLLLLMLAATAVVALSQDTPAEPPAEPAAEPPPAAATYALPVMLPADLPPRCADWARQKRAQFAADDRRRDRLVDLVFAGDSLIEGFAPLPLAGRYEVVNRGIACDTTRGLHERLLRDVAALRPRLAVLLIGINDLFLLDRLPPDDRSLLTAVDIESLALRLQGHRIKPVVLSLLPTRVPVPGLSVAGTNELIRDLNVELRRFCRRLGILFVDVHGALADHRRWLREDLSGDGLHPNMEGYRLLSNLLAPVLKTELKEPD